MSREYSSRGAYGFRLIYPEGGDSPPPDDLVELDEAAPEVLVSWRYATTIVDIEEIGTNRVVYGVRGATTFEVNLDPRTIHMDLPAPVVPGALVHPLLTVGISILARWRGDVTLHAGAFETPTGAWGVLGTREAGKSSILASVGERGYPVVADDLLTILDGSAWAGPACVDLRPDTAIRYKQANYMGIVGGRPRYRLSTTPGRTRVPLRGFFLLDWHDDSEITFEPLSAKDRLQFLYRQEYIRLVGHSDPANLVPLIALPAWRLTRPKNWSATEEVVDRMLSTADEA